MNSEDTSVEDLSRLLFVYIGTYYVSPGLKESQEGALWKKLFNYIEKLPQSS